MCLSGVFSNVCNGVFQSSSLKSSIVVSFAVFCVML
jgi:hypothetical protein